MAIRIWSKNQDAIMSRVIEDVKVIDTNGTHGKGFDVIKEKTGEKVGSFNYEDTDWYEVGNYESN